MSTPVNVTVRPITPADYDAVMSLWSGQDGVGLSGADEPKSIAVYLGRNEGLSLLAERGSTVVGAVLCGHDGRRGYLYHLAVTPRWRGKRIGTLLVEGACEQLARSGIAKCHIFVYAGNSAGHAFWEACGWERRSDLVVYSRNLL